MSDKRSLKERFTAPGTKYMIIGVIALLAILVLLPLSFLRHETVYSASGLTFPEKNIHVNEETGTVHVTTDSFALRPGVYEVTLSAEIPEESTLSCELKTRNESFKALRTNQVNYLAHKRSVSFEAFVSDKLPDCYLDLNFEQADLDGLSEITLVRSGRSYLRTLSILLLLLGLIVLFMALRDRILSGRTDALGQVTFWVLLVSILVAFYPYLSDYIIIRNETLRNCLRMEGVTESLTGGTSFPLWAGNLFYLLSAMFRMLGFGLSSAFKYLHLVIIAATALLARHCLDLCTGDRKASLMGALLYVFSPYFLNAMYMEGAVDKAIAYSLLPPVGAGLVMLLRAGSGADASRTSVSAAASGDRASVCAGSASAAGDRASLCADTESDRTRGMWYLALGLTGLFQSHLPSFMGAALLTLAVLLLFAPKVIKGGKIMPLLKTAGIFLLLNAWSLAGYLVNRGPLFGNLRGLAGAFFTKSTLFHMNITLLVCFAAACLVRKFGKTYIVMPVSAAALFYGLYRTNHIAMDAFAARLYSAPAIGSPDSVYEGLKSATHPVILAGLAVSILSVIAFLALPVLRNRKEEHND